MGNAGSVNTREKLGLKVVCISDTHGHHNDLDLPAGDILIHGGDFTHFGKKKDVLSFNEWLGTLDFEHKIIVNGNHESNADWSKDVKEILSNATFILEETVEVKGVKIYGTNFHWPCPSGNPYFDLIPADSDIVIAHGPAKGFVDNDGGCPSLTKKLSEIRPRLFVCGHIHGAHGVDAKTWGGVETIFVNAANVKKGYSLGWDPVVVEI